MTDKFDYKITKEPEKEFICLIRPNPDCKSPLHRYPAIGQKTGTTKCNNCGCEFEWERKEE